MAASIAGETTLPSAQKRALGHSIQEGGVGGVDALLYISYSRLATISTIFESGKLDAMLRRDDDPILISEIAPLSTVTTSAASAGTRVIPLN